ncbi:hypothetical protein FHG87_003809, partial [Trinorchestia longiramus]
MQPLYRTPAPTEAPNGANNHDLGTPNPLRRRGLREQVLIQSKSSCRGRGTLMDDTCPSFEAIKLLSSSNYAARWPRFPYHHFSVKVESVFGERFQVSLRSIFSTFSNARLRIDLHRPTRYFLPSSPLRPGSGVDRRLSPGWLPFLLLLSLFAAPTHSFALLQKKTSSVEGQQQDILLQEVHDITTGANIGTRCTGPPQYYMARVNLQDVLVTLKFAELQKKAELMAQILLGSGIKDTAPMQWALDFLTAEEELVLETRVVLRVNQKLATVTSGDDTRAPLLRVECLDVERLSGKGFSEENWSVNNLSGAVVSSLGYEAVFGDQPVKTSVMIWWRSCTDVTAVETKSVAGSVNIPLHDQPWYIDFTRTKVWPEDRFQDPLLNSETEPRTIRDVHEDRPLYNLSLPSDSGGRSGSSAGPNLVASSTTPSGDAGANFESFSSQHNDGEGGWSPTKHPRTNDQTSDFEKSYQKDDGESFKSSLRASFRDIVARKKRSVDYSRAHWVGRWTYPYYQCESKLWVVALVVPSALMGTRAGRQNLDGVFVVDVDITRLDINQCDRPPSVPSTSPFDFSESDVEPYDDRNGSSDARNGTSGASDLWPGLDNIPDDSFYDSSEDRALEDELKSQFDAGRQIGFFGTHRCPNTSV